MECRSHSHDCRATERTLPTHIVWLASILAASSNRRSRGSAVNESRATHPLRLQCDATKQCGVREFNVHGCVALAWSFLGGARLAARHALPAIYELSGFVLAGGLMSYATSLPGTYRQAADYVVRVLAGVKPADLPMQQPEF